MVSGAVAADVVVDVNGNMVTASDHNFNWMVPLTQDTRSKQSLIKVINKSKSLSFGFI